MSGNTTSVDVLSLEDFRTTLDARLSEAESLLTKLTATLRGRPPRLGDFVDATSTSTRYEGLHAEHIDRVQRLIRAINAARAATDTIMASYRTVEARNAASATDIGNALGDVNGAINGQHHG